MESKTLSLIVFYLLPMPSVWSKKISCTKKHLLRSLKKIYKKAQKQQQQGKEKRQ